MTDPFEAPLTSAMSTLGEGLRGEVMRGLLSTPKSLPPKLFYDADGSRLFERISELREYYLTRAELEILRGHSAEISELTGRGVALIEYGSGAGLKVRTLLDTMQPVAYVPVDIACEQLGRVAGRIAFDYPRIWVRPVCTDYTMPLRLPALQEGVRRVGFFPGSTIGNFHPSEAATFLRTMRRTLGPTGALLIGVDRKKDPRMIEAAYNDPDGVTAQFNLNILHRLNREFGGHFHPGAFAHRAFFNQQASRVEMHLVSRVRQTVFVGDAPIHFEPGETIRTEYSYKYDDPELERLSSAGGFVLRKKWTDSHEYFWVAYLEAKAERLPDWRGVRVPR